MMHCAQASSRQVIGVAHSCVCQLSCCCHVLGLDCRRLDDGSDLPQGAARIVDEGDVALDDDEDEEAGMQQGQQTRRVLHPDEEIEAEEAAAAAAAEQDDAEAGPGEGVWDGRTCQSASAAVEGTLSFQPWLVLVRCCAEPL
jgi:hypothetical protein